MCAESAWRNEVSSVRELPKEDTLSRAPKGRDPAWDQYLSSCTDYLKRQLLVYQNWPQRKYDPMGYKDEKVFTDMNA
jgi:hypothetical protein